MDSFLSKTDLICIPTSPTPAPLKGSLHRREGPASDYYRRTLSLTSIAGVARLPQITLPLGTTDGLPTGLSLIAKTKQDSFLLSTAAQYKK
jgi:amidase